MPSEALPAANYMMSDWRAKVWVGSGPGGITVLYAPTSFTRVGAGSL